MYGSQIITMATSNQLHPQLKAKYIIDGFIGVRMNVVNTKFIYETFVDC